MKKVAKYIAMAALLNGGVSLAQDSGAELKTYSIGARLVHLYDVASPRFDSEFNQDLKGLNGENTKLDFGFDLYGEKQFTPFWGLQLGLRMGGLTGANENEYFKNSFVEGYGDILFYLSNLDKKRMNSPWNYYIKTGVGAGKFSAERFLVQDDSPNGEVEDGYWEARVGAGLQYEINTQLRVELDFAYNAAFSDGFDGYNGATGSDPYFSTGIGLAYTFGSKDSRAMYAVSFFEEDYFGATSQGGGMSDQESQQKMNAMAGQLDSANSQIEQMDAQIKEQNEAIARLEEKMNEAIAASAAAAEANKKVATVEGDMIAAPTGVEHEIYFAFDSHHITDEYKRMLKSQLKGSENSVVLTGYADKTGSSTYNHSLKRRRAEEVKKFLVEELGYHPSAVRTLAADRMVDLDDDDSQNRKVVVQAQ